MTAAPAAAPAVDLVELVGAASRGDEAAWSRLIDMFGGCVRAAARSHRLNPADTADVSQTTWLRLIENVQRVQQPERIGAWLTTTARRESLRVLRTAAKRGRMGECDLQLLPDPAAPVDGAGGFIAEQRREVLARLLDQLPARSQVLLELLSRDCPASYKDISQVLGMPVGSIGPTRGRALEQVRRLAAKAGIDLEDLVDS